MKNITCDLGWVGLGRTARGNRLGLDLDGFGVKDGMELKIPRHGIGRILIVPKDGLEKEQSNYGPQWNWRYLGVWNFGISKSVSSSSSCSSCSCCSLFTFSVLCMQSLSCFPICLLSMDTRLNCLGPNEGYSISPRVAVVLMPTCVLICVLLYLF